MTISEHRSKKKVCFGDGFIDWFVLCAVDEDGLVQAKAWGAVYEWCLRDIKDAIRELTCEPSFSY